MSPHQCLSFFLINDDDDDDNDDDHDDHDGDDHDDDDYNNTDVNIFTGVDSPERRTVLALHHGTPLFQATDGDHGDDGDDFDGGGIDGNDDNDDGFAPWNSSLPGQFLKIFSALSSSSSSSSSSSLSSPSSSSSSFSPEELREGEMCLEGERGGPSARGRLTPA